MREQGIPCERLGRRGGEGCSRASAATTSRSCCTSPRPACCARSARCRRSRPQAVAHGATLVRGRRADGRTATRGRWTTAAARGRRRRVGVRRWLAGLFGELVTLRGDAPGAAVLRRRAGVAAPGARGGSTTTARCTGRATSTASGSRPRSTSRARRSTPTRPLDDGRRPSRPSAPTSRDRFPALAHAPLRGAHLPLRALARLALHRRAPPRARRACGWSAAAPGTASSTARRWPSGWPRPGRRRAAAAALRARRPHGGPRLRTAGPDF